MDAPPHAALILNPRSGGDNRKGRALADMLRSMTSRKGNTHISVHVLERFPSLFAHLKEEAARGTEALFISAGDGTVQAVQTWLAENLPADSLPMIGILPHGSTNMTAAELGLSFKDRAQEAQYIASGAWRQESAQRIVRPTLKVENPSNAGPQHGMFLGGGAIAAGTLYCQEAFNRKGVRGNTLAPALTLMRTAGKALFAGPPAPEEEDRLDRPWPMRVTADGEIIGDGLHVALLVSTLDRLVFGARPFVESEYDGALRFSLFRHPPPSLLRWLPVIIWARKDPKSLPPGMISRPVKKIEVKTSAPFVIDGERLLPPIDEPLRISLGPTFTFLRG